MAHIHRIEDSHGDLVDLIYFCSDWCHQSWCDKTLKAYDGWDGCHELQTSQPCEWCQDTIEGYDD